MFNISLGLAYVLSSLTHDFKNDDNSNEECNLEIDPNN